MLFSNKLMFVFRCSLNLVNPLFYFEKICFYKPFPIFMSCFIITCIEFYFRTAMLMLMLMLVLKTFLCQSADKSLRWIAPKAKFMLASCGTLDCRCPGWTWHHWGIIVLKITVDLLSCAPIDPVSSFVLQHHQALNQSNSIDAMLQQPWCAQMNKV